MVMASEEFEESPEDIVRVVIEDLFSELADYDEEEPNPEYFNPYPEAIRGRIKVIDLDDEFFMVRFSDPEDYNHALFEGLWLITDHYLLVQRWHPGFKPRQDSLKKIVVWVRIPDLPMELYNPHFQWRDSNPPGAPFNSPFSCFGPWMLAKKPQRRALKPGFTGSNKDGGNLGSKSNGSRFDILHMDTGDIE
ncbi:hypothetical protein SESBI_22322 [Sesbania bispinosa]|nr:hypothetical protein SESBI_22322 [Sesbania bispinosa]